MGITKLFHDVFGTFKHYIRNPSLTKTKLSTNLLSNQYSRTSATRLR